MNFLTTFPKKLHYWVSKRKNPLARLQNPIARAIRHNFFCTLPDDVKIVNCYCQWPQRLFLEEWHSIREPNSIYEHSTFIFQTSMRFFITDEGYSILTEVPIFTVLSQ